ncbi:hypothetical protein ACLB2K_042214 [Fragaria x ananassa]
MLNYLDAFAKEFCFHRDMLRSRSFDKLMPLKEFTDATNGYLIGGTCVLGAEIFVCKERTKGIRECLSRTNDLYIGKQFTLRIVDQKHGKHKTWTVEYCFTANSLSCGKPQYISLSNLEAEGFLKKNTCILEADVFVYGVSKEL